ncbi:MAG: PQQ-dependent sugar dehydrogenase [Pirellulales bacterium]
MRLDAEIRQRCRWLLLAGLWGLVAGGTLRAPSAEETRRPPWTTSHLQGSPLPPEPYRLVPACGGRKFERPTSIEELSDPPRMLVTEMGGKVFTFPRGDDAAPPDLALDLVKLLPPELAARGVSLFDAELHPQFATRRQLFLCYVHPGNGGHTRVSRFTVAPGTPPRVVPDSEEVLITWPSGGHNAGCLEFGREGWLYISTGDGSGPNPPDGLTTGQTVTDLLGAVLRIDVDRTEKDRKYAIPADNPFVHQEGARPEIWGYGLRNPWKFGIDPQTGEVFVADNGWETWEMIHRVGRGGNCGWPVMEGRVALRSEVAVGPTPIVPPILDHPHTEANSVIGGPVYRGSRLPQLQGAFIYGDYITGTIWAVQPDGRGSYAGSTLLDTDLRIVAFTQTQAGELLVLDYDFSGQIYEILPSDVPDTSATFPRRLSDTGLFTSVERLEPAPGVIPYAVQAERWMDGATAQRWIAIPGDGQVTWSADGQTPTQFPPGTVLVKHLSLPQPAGQPPVRLETQLLHFERGTWRPYSYLWNDAGTDATLVPPIGTTRTLNDSAAPPSDAATTPRGVTSSAEDPAARRDRERTWHVHAVNECKLCHNAGPQFVLGFTRHQLDRPLASGGNGSQLVSLARLGVTSPAPAVAGDDPSRLVDPHDAQAPLVDRARSYLHANCSMCHHPGGNAIVSFYLRRDLPFEKLNTNKGTGIGTFGMRQAKIIVPGDPYRSVLFYRMSKLGYARMPYIGSRVVDSRGVALVEAWIRSLTGDKESDAAARSAPATPTSTLAKDLQSLADHQADAVAAERTLRDAVSSTEGALALVARMHRGQLTPRDFSRAVAAGGAAPTDIRGLFDTFIPEARRRATLGAGFAASLVLDKAGDRERGRLIFASDGARCRNCHDLENPAQSLGPTLRDIAKKYPQPEELLRHITQPSLKIDESFAAYTAVVDDGRVLQGLLVEQTPERVALKTLERQVVRIPRQKLEELRRGDKSLMPDQVLSDLTAQEAADLLAYIRSVAP